MKNKIEKAFTLIELLVVIAIIGILAGILFVAINPKAQADKAKDAKRLRYMKEVQKALSMYQLDHGEYPQGGWFYDCQNNTSWNNTLGNALKEYMPTMMNDPDKIWPLCFYYKSGDYPQCSGTGHGYTLIFTTKKSIFNLKKYNIQGEGGTAARYCLHDDE